ncbi:phage tail tape measure protein [Streptomyces longwoodensis]|uniref:phage tail tape measure protein n=1 Tax=Streptomyces longwoodensis TaxID=68231 RepID=UPI0036EFBCB7
MALTVGELRGIIRIDDRAVRPALRRVEQAMRQTGDNLGDDAERAGQQAGQQLGGGFVRGADGQWRTIRGDLVDEVTAATLEAEREAHRGGQRMGQQLGDGLTPAARRAGEDAGDAAGDGLTDEGSAGADEAVSGWTERLGKLKAGVAVIGAAAGAALMTAFNDVLEQGQVTARLGAQLGKTPAEARRYGKIAGQLYANAVTEDFQGAADAISAVMRAGIVPTGATNKQIQSIATKVTDLANTFDLDLGQTANAVGQMLKTGLAKNGTEAVDAIAAAMPKLGQRADDVADTFNEYSVIFQRLGLDAKTAMGIMSQGLQAGARDTDVVADALKEFTLEGVQGSAKITKGFKDIGLNSDKMVKMIAKGGPGATKALQMTLDKLRAMEDPVKRDAAATELFGTKSEDTQKALLALDPKHAVDTLGQVAGASERMGDTLRDNAGTKLEAFKRGMQQKLVDFLGGTVLPGLTNFRTRAGQILGSLWAEAGKGDTAGADRVIAFVEILGQRLKAKAIEQAPKLISGLQTMGQRVAEYVMANPDTVLKVAALAGAIIFAVSKLPVLVAGALAAAAITMMVGFVGRMGSALIENLPKWWLQFNGWIVAKAASAGSWMASLGVAIGGWFGGLWSRYIAGPVSRTWNSFLIGVRALSGRTQAALVGLPGALLRVALNAWMQFYNGTMQRTSAVLGYVRSIPSRISSAVGAVNGLLYSKGVAVVQGLWAGISSMGGWLQGQLMSWARSVIPGPIAKALGINSPSKVTTAQGRWIARGLIAGLTGSTKQVRAASQKLADIVRDSMSPGRARSKALSTISSGTKKLLAYASVEQKVAARLGSARKALATYVAARAKITADVKKGVLDDANITQSSGSDPATADSILNGLRADRAAAERFASDLAKLRAKGVRADLIAQIAQAGVAQGGSAASALAAASANQVKAINSEQAALVKAAGNAGVTAGTAMYGAGIQAAKGLVMGLQSQQKRIEQQMLAIAKSMSKSIKKALGIKSPSRVMALVGAYTAEGLREGIESGRTAVNRSMASLVETPAPGEWPTGVTARRPGRGRADGKPQFVLRTDGTRAGRFLMEVMRSAVDVRGGDVQFAVTGRG